MNLTKIKTRKKIQKLSIVISVILGSTLAQSRNETSDLLEFIFNQNENNGTPLKYNFHTKPRQYSHSLPDRPLSVLPNAFSEPDIVFFEPKPGPFDLLGLEHAEPTVAVEPIEPMEPETEPFVESSVHSDRNSQGSVILRKANKRRRRRKRKKRMKNKNKTKKKKGNKNKNKKKKKPEQNPFQSAHVIFTSVTTEKPHHPTWSPVPIPVPTRTTTLPPYKKKIKYILRKHNALKKIKKEYFSHLGHVIYPFVKFVAFFAVLNPFTFGVFFFSLISPIVFGILGFLALSFFIRPALHLLFDVKKHVGHINHRRWQEKRRRERLRNNYNNQRPITIHKHFYHNGRTRPYHHRRAIRLIEDKSTEQQPIPNYNPILPSMRSRIYEANEYFGPAFLKYQRIPVLN